MVDFEIDGFDLDLEAKEPEKVSGPLWYYDDDVAQSYKDIVDVALRSFEKKLEFIHELKSGSKVKVKEWKLVAASLNAEAGLNPGYLRNKHRRDVKRTIDFVNLLNDRLEAAFNAQKSSNVRPTVSDRKAAYASLLEKYRKLEQLRLSEFAKAAFENDMSSRLAAQQHSYASLFRKNNELLDDKARLEVQVERLQGKLIEAYEEISRLKDQLKTKSQMKVVD